MDADGAITVHSLEEAAEQLERIHGNLLVLTGSRELPEICSRIRDTERLYVRVLPDPEAILSARKAGIQASHIIGMQGPFTMETNLALIRQVQAKAILTKKSGPEGGFSAKAEAARTAGIPVVIWEALGTESDTDGISAEEFLSGLIPGWRPERILTLIGTGPGGAGYWTEEGAYALHTADALFGSRGVLERAEAAGMQTGGIPHFCSYNGNEIRDVLNAHPEIRHPAALFSGDTGLFSGAAGVEAIMSTEPEWSIRVIPGVSTAALMAARVGACLQKCRIVSSHGRKLSIVPQVISSPQTLVYTSGKKDAAEIRDELALAVREGILPEGTELIVGDNLSLPGEMVCRLPLDGTCPEIPEGLLILFVRKPDSEGSPYVRILEDDELIRNGIPMTKRDIRILALSELGLWPGAVFWDIGSGTGSVSLQASLAVPGLEAYAVERNPDAADLTQRNLDRFGCTNVRVVRGNAPEALEELPVPTHVFLGGTGKSAVRILKAVLERAPAARIIATCITLDTLTEMYRAMKELPVRSVSIRQIAVSIAKHLGNSDLMLAENPVFLISCTGDPGAWTSDAREETYA